MRKLEDSDGCIYVHDGPDGEIFAVGVYTDNCMIVHSAKLDGDGNAIDPNSYYAKFKAAFESEWDIVDEGEVDDVLAMQVVRNDSGSVTIHMEKYVEKVLAKWLPGGPLPRVQDNSLPVLGIYRYHTGMDRFSDYKSLVLVCGLQSGLGQF